MVFMGLVHPLFHRITLLTETYDLPRIPSEIALGHGRLVVLQRQRSHQSGEALGGVHVTHGL